MSERELWFITRPERDPRFHRDGLLALAEVTEGFTLRWTGNRDLHKLYEKKLIEHGVKRDNISTDGSGGRTWAALMKTFSYCYVADDGYMVPTKAGLQIIKGNKIYENVRKQILTLQIPNAYFLESGFRPKFAPNFAIRPVMFLLKLCCRPDLDYQLTKEEITYFALPAKKDNEVDNVAERIRQFRCATGIKQSEIKTGIAAELEHRERSDSSARSFEVAHSDVAHTFMLITEYTGLAEYARGRALRVDPSKASAVHKELSELEIRYPFNTRYKISLQRMAENSGLDVDSFKASPPGAAKPAANKTKILHKLDNLLIGVPNPGSLSQEELTAMFSRELPFKEAKEYASALLVAPGVNNRFVDGYLSETDNRAFEDKTGEILKQLGFKVEMRPKVSGCSTEIEILVKFDNKCGVIDCKNYKQNFALTALLASHMAGEYIPNYSGYEGRDLHFFAYVTASSFSGEKNLKKISSKSLVHIPSRTINGVMLNARTLVGLLDVFIENDIPPRDRVEYFLKCMMNQGFDSIEKLMRHVGPLPNRTIN